MSGASPSPLHNRFRKKSKSASVSPSPPKSKPKPNGKNSKNSSYTPVNKPKKKQRTESRSFSSSIFNRKKSGSHSNSSSPKKDGGSGGGAHSSSKSNIIGIDEHDDEAGAAAAQTTAEQRHALTQQPPQRKPSKTSKAKNIIKRASVSIANKSKKTDTDTVTKKRLVISTQLDDPFSVFKSEIHSKLNGFEYLCCGGWRCHCCYCYNCANKEWNPDPNEIYGHHCYDCYCALCCLCLTEKKIVTKVAQQISRKLTQKGIENEYQLSMDDASQRDSFIVIVSKMATVKQMVGKYVIEDQIKAKLKKKGIKATVAVGRKKMEIVGDKQSLLNT